MKTTDPRKYAYYFCFHPYCQESQNTRVFLPSGSSQDHKALCHKWIASPSQMAELLGEFESVHQGKDVEELNLDSSPIENMIDFTKRKTAIR